MISISMSAIDIGGRASTMYSSRAQAVLMYCVGYLLLTCVGCGCPTPEPACIQSEEQYNQSINTFDFTASPPTPVALFIFRQATTTWEAPSCRANPCPAIASAVSLDITNSASRSVSFTYRAQFQLNAVTWSSQGAVTQLAVGGSASQGQVSANPARIDLGTFTIPFGSLSYGP